MVEFNVKLYEITVDRYLTLVSRLLLVVVCLSGDSLMWMKLYVRSFKCYDSNVRIHSVNGSSSTFGSYQSLQIMDC